MNHLDWVSGFLGGLILGIGGAILLLCNGRIMGASGLLGRLIDGTESKPRVENIVFLTAMILGPLIFGLTPGVGSTNLIDNAAILIAGGILVGFGSRMANGCTSGHGVCGISRLSKRGVFATILYVASGVPTVLILRHLEDII